MRSSSKPIQALPLPGARPDLDDREPCDRSSSTGRRTINRSRARAAREGAATETTWSSASRKGGSPRRSSTTVGKHAGMLALCPRARLPAAITGFRSIRCSRRALRRTAEASKPMRRVPDGNRRLRRRDVRAPARAHGLRLAASSTAPGRPSPRDAHAPRPRRRPDGADYPPDAAAAAVRQGWRQGLCAPAAPADGVRSRRRGAHRPLGPALAAFLLRLAFVTRAGNHFRTNSPRGARFGELAVRPRTPERFFTNCIGGLRSQSA